MCTFIKTITKTSLVGLLALLFSANAFAAVDVYEEEYVVDQRGQERVVEAPPPRTQAQSNWEQNQDRKMLQRERERERGHLLREHR